MSSWTFRFPGMKAQRKIVLTSCMPFTCVTYAPLTAALAKAHWWTYGPAVGGPLREWGAERDTSAHMIKAPDTKRTHLKQKAAPMLIDP